MAKQLKRKGKTFVTEHYVTPDLVEAFNDTVMRDLKAMMEI